MEDIMEDNLKNFQSEGDHMSLTFENPVFQKFLREQFLNALECVD